MKVLLLHPEDDFPQPRLRTGWDLVVDFGRAPNSTYERWVQAGVGRVVSLYDFVDDAEDLHRLKSLLGLGLGRMVDPYEIDWWDVTSLMVATGLMEALWLQRLASELAPGTELYASRPDPRFEALRARLGVTLANLAGDFNQTRLRIQHYSKAFAHLDFRTLMQVMQDKFDPQHVLRKRFRRKQSAFDRPHAGGPLVLLPSAYSNVSRTAVAYAAMLPDYRFLLALARQTGRIGPLPANVHAVSLDPYFGKADEKEVTSRLNDWETLRRWLISAAEEYKIADASGTLGAIPRLLRWGTAVRDAWNQLYQSENITACLSADDGNPYSRIPLMLAKKRGIPALGCHHGALDYRMAIKPLHADFYLAKSDMEREYLVDAGVAPDKIVPGAPQSLLPAADLPSPQDHARRWLVFFTEPYGVDAWRTEEVYRDLLPNLVELGDRCGLQIVFKLHPFENIPAHRRLLRRHLPAKRVREIEVLAGPITRQIWHKMHFAMTVQSTVALECFARGIPVFLCGWLGSRVYGYIREYEKFGIGQVLNSREEIAGIPDFLRQAAHAPMSGEGMWKKMDPRDLETLLSGRRKIPVSVQ